LRASLKTGVARRTEPDELAGKDFLFHSEKGHPDDLSRVVSVGHLSHRAAGRAGTTGKTLLDVLSSWLRSNEKLKLGVKRLGVDHTISNSNHWIANPNE
jgi:hypothetical protein